MSTDKIEPFVYHSDYKIPDRLKELIIEAKKAGKGSPLSVLVVRDTEGNEYEIVLRKDRERAWQRYFKKYISSVCILDVLGK